MVVTVLECESESFVLQNLSPEHLLQTQHQKENLLSHLLQKKSTLL
jgi:hypothetical protein